MKENISIFLLLLVTTVAFSFLLVKTYDSTRGKEVSSESVISDNKMVTATPVTTIVPTLAASPTVAVNPTEALTAQAAPGITPVSIVTPTAVGRPVSLVTPTGSQKEERDVTSTTTPTPTEEASPTPTPRDLIVDLDYNSDVDDTAALRVAAVLDRMERVEIKAVMASTSGEKVCQAMHAQLRYDGYGSVPIGAAVQQVTGGSPYWDRLIDNYFSAADYRLYNSVELYKAVLRELDALERERVKERKRLEEEWEEERAAALSANQALSDNRAGNKKEERENTKEDEEEEEFELPLELQETEKLRIVTTGYLTNVASLLQDPEGYSLVARYVDSIWITGGIWLQGEDHNFVVSETTAAAARYVLAHSPVPLIFSSSASITNEDGSSIFCGSSILAMDKAGTDPVAMAFRAYGEKNNTPMNGGRYAWDPFCVWVASTSIEETQTHFEPVYLSIGDNGYNKFRYDLPPNCNIIRRNTEDLGWYAQQIELLIDAGLR